MIDDIYILKNNNYKTNLFIKNKILEGKIINIISDNAEFGPRALGNTSTICLPTKENSEYINKCNNRVNEMPMAPILLEENLDYFFYQNEYSRCLDILKYMIITLKYKKHISNNVNYSGIMHNHPIDDYYTGRPQILFKDQKNHILYETLKMLNDIGVKALINTSFNIHGLKTALFLEHIISDFEYQKKIDNKNKIITIFVTKYYKYDFYFYKKIMKIMKIKKNKTTVKLKLMK
jgi:predicted NodU family carbamoyl transferase